MVLFELVIFNQLSVINIETNNADMCDCGNEV